MALSSLKFKPGFKRELETTKKGVPIYGGEPSKYHDWEFMVQLRMASLDVENDSPKDFAMAAQNISEELTGDA
jgi:hypothetical protein